MLTSSMLGNDANQIDIDVALPEHPASSSAARAQYRQAVSQARAIRRAAAQEARAVKRRAAAQARELLAAADAARKAQSARQSNLVQPSPTDEEVPPTVWLVHQSGNLTEPPAVVLSELHPKPVVRPVAAPAVEAVAAAVPVATPAVEAVVAAIPVAEPVTEAVAAAIPVAEPAVEPVAAAIPVFEPAVETVAAAIPVAEPVVETVAAAIPVAEPAVEAVAAAIPVTEPAVAATTESFDPLVRAQQAELAHAIAKQQALAWEQQAAVEARAYANATKSARPLCRSLTRQTRRQWKREANALHAAAVLPRTARYTAIGNLVVCGVLLVGVAIGMLALERPTVSDIENRALATMPAPSVEGYLDGSLTEGITNYYNDTIPFRSVLKNATATIRQYMGWQSGGAVIHGNLQVGETEPAQTTPAQTDVTTVTAVNTDPALTVTTTTSTVTTPAADADPAVDQGELSNNILICDNRGIMLYGGSFAVGERYASYVNAYKQDLGADVQVYSLVAPTPCSFYTPEAFQSMIGSEARNIQNINDHLVDVVPVDAFHALEAHQTESIFMRTDHHWSARGAFYAAEAFSAAARVPFAQLSSYEAITKPGYVGTLYGYSGDITLKNHPEDFTYYVPSNAFTTTYYNPGLGAKRTGNLFCNLDHLAPVSWYMVYMGGDERVTHITTDVPNGRKLVMLKDSYGNALVPWLTSSFEEITVIDLRYFEQNVISYIRSIGATDVLFAMNTFSATGGNSKWIETLRTQP